MPNIIRGAAVDKNHFVGVTNLGELCSAGLRRPSSSFNNVSGEAKSHPGVGSCYNLRATVQRRFDKARRDRAETYARYIDGVQTGEITGGFPPINVYVDGNPRIDGDTMTLDYTDPICVIDGETQTEARFILADENADVYQWPIAVVVWHSLPNDTAPRQYLVDCNQYATPMASKTAMAMDTTGRLTIAVRNAVQIAGFTADDINPTQNLPSTRKRFSLCQLMAAGAGYVMNGYTYGRSYAGIVAELNNPVPSDDVFTFDSDSVSTNVAGIINAVLGHGVGNKTSPMVWIAAGILVRQNYDVRKLNFAAAAEIKPNGSVDTKIETLKNALNRV